LVLFVYVSFSFHFPFGVPNIQFENSTKLKAIEEVFRHHNDKVSLAEMREICAASQLCTLWKRPLYECIAVSHQNFICYGQFAQWWKTFKSSVYDEAAQFVYILTKGSRNYLVPNDFEPLIQDLIDTLPSLQLLKDEPSFHSAYIETVK
uniref:EF-hand_13 domain-containing protein n=1 Tax=Gongylonema pulchrum TaxID=637853 RepID=A0A183EL72_9BILA